MIHIRCMNDLEVIEEDPELYREAASTLLFCQHEIQLYCDDDEDFDFSLTVFSGY